MLDKRLALLLDQDQLLTLLSRWLCCEQGVASVGDQERFDDVARGLATNRLTRRRLIHRSRRANLPRGVGATPKVTLKSVERVELAPLLQTKGEL
jgi:hypothetical protein